MTNLITKSIIIVGSAVAVSACSTSSPAPTKPSKTVRQSVLSAPVDLQLICAAATSRRFSIAKNDVIPVDSRAIAKGLYQVDLRFDNGSSRCTINDQAQVQNIRRI